MKNVEIMAALQLQLLVSMLHVRLQYSYNIKDNTAAGRPCVQNDWAAWMMERIVKRPDLPKYQTVTLFQQLFQHSNLG